MKDHILVIIKPFLNPRILCIAELSQFLFPKEQLQELDES